MFGAERTAPAHVAFGDEITTVHTTAGWLSRGISFSTTAYGGDNDDRFQVYSNKAPLKLFGEDDNDEFVVRAFVLDTGELGTSDTLLSGGGGDDHIEYNINAPVSIDGGAGVDSVVVIGTEVNDNFAITEDGVQGAGLNVHYENVERLEVDGLEGDDNFFVLSTSPRVVTTIIGGLGSDTVNVGGDVTQRIVALSVEGVSGFINHTLTSTDPAYDGVFADGIHVSVANGSAGTVVVEPSGGDSTAIEDRPGANVDTYTMRLAAAAPTDGTVAYLTVSATPAPSKDRAADGKLLEVSLDNVHYVHALVLTFDSSAASGATAWARTQTIYVRAASDTASEGERVAVVSHSIESTNPAFDRRPIANVEVKVIDNDRAGLIVTQTGTTTQVVEGGASDTYTVSLTRSPDPGETVTVTVARDTTQVSTPVTVTFTDADWMTNKTVTVSAVNDTNVENRRITTLIHTVTSDGAVFGAVAEQPEVDVDVRDNDAGGLIVDESGGTTLVSDGHPDTYTIRLTKAPTADVTVGILTDGKTVVTSSDARFTAATATSRAVRSRTARSCRASACRPRRTIRCPSASLSATSRSRPTASTSSTTAASRRTPAPSGRSRRTRPRRSRRCTTARSPPRSSARSAASTWAARSRSTTARRPRTTSARSAAASRTTTLRSSTSCSAGTTTRSPSTRRRRARSPSSRVAAAATRSRSPATAAARPHRSSSSATRARTASSTTRPPAA
ncbi:MAG: hypothetical protein E6J52_13645 [Chloroflexi bacterium]|nr:MAG: hypothetical protein E6J52_13645 [Chloroflexota bacterium]